MMMMYDEGRPMMEEEMIKKDGMILEEWMLMKEGEGRKVGETTPFILSN